MIPGSLAGTIRHPCSIRPATFVSNLVENCNREFSGLSLTQPGGTERYDSIKCQFAKSTSAFTRYELSTPPLRKGTEAQTLGCLLDLPICFEKSCLRGVVIGAGQFAHDAHCAIPQPNFVPVRPSRSRSTHSNGMSSGASTAPIRASSSGTAGRRDLYERAFPLVRDAVAAWGLDLRRGWEVYPSLVADGEDPRGYVLEGTRAVLVEFPGWWLDVDGAVGLVADAARNVERAGLVPILAHPERCPPVAADPASVRRLAEAGWPLCLNGPSLTGDHGETAERTAWRLLEDGVVSIVASDAATRALAASASGRAP